MALGKTLGKKQKRKGLQITDDRPAKRPDIDSREDPTAIARSELAEANAKLLASGKGSDLTITCGGQTFKVHKAIVCSRSDVLAAACWGGFKASTGSSSIKIETSLSSEQEGESGCIQLSDDDPAIFSKLLHYLYVLEYDDYETEDSQSESKSSILDSKEIVSTPSKLSNHASLYVMSDKYGVKGLKTIVGAKFNEALPLPIQLRDPSKLLPPFISAIDKIYTEIPSSNDPLRLDILCFLQGNIRRILHIEDFKNLLAKFPELSFALLEHAVRPLQDSAPSASEDVDKGSLVELMRARIARLEDNSDYA